MEAMLIYLLKSAGLISIFYIAYVFLLKNDTSFILNRQYLVAGIIASAILPTLYFTKKVFIENPGDIFYNYEDLVVLDTHVYIENTINWWQIAGILYLIITGLLMLRFLIHLFRILYLINRYPNYSHGKYKFIETSRESGPFSFFNYIVFNPSLHTSNELDLIITHEKVHASQLHTLDILLGNLFTCLLWFNPFCWFYKESMVQNLEYIADRDTVARSSSKKDYLKTLVKVSCGDLQPALTNSFYQSFIKKRIIMINKKTQPTNNGWKIGIVLPVILAFMFAFNIQTEIIAQEQPTKITNSSIEIRLDIDKNTSREVLDKYISTMNQYDVILNFEDVKYNSEGLLTHIKMEFLDRSNVSSGNVTKSNKDGIAPFRYVYHSEEGSRFTTPKSHAHTSASSAANNVDVQVITSAAKDTAKILVRGLPGANAQPVYIVNGKVVKREDLNINPENIDNVHVLKGKSAVYTRDGIIIISTKSQHDSIHRDYNELRGKVFYIDSLNGKMFQKMEDSIIRKQKSFIKTGGDIIATQYGTNQNSFIIRNFKEERPPLYIVDGEEMGKDYEVNDLDPNNISSIQVFKDATATLKYGEKAKYGAIEITTRKKNSKSASSPDNLAVISADASNDILKITKNQLKDLSNVDITYENVERNRRGKITGIKITAKYDNKISSATFQVNKGIPDVYVGLRNGNPIVSSSPPAGK